MLTLSRLYPSFSISDGTVTAYWQSISSLLEEDGDLACTIEQICEGVEIANYFSPDFFPPVSVIERVILTRINRDEARRAYRALPRGSKVTFELIGEQVDAFRRKERLSAPAPKPDYNLPPQRQLSPSEQAEFAEFNVKCMQANERLQAGEITEKQYASLVSVALFKKIDAQKIPVYPGMGTTQIIEINREKRNAIG
jgi:hypothetical protein